MNKVLRKCPWLFMSAAMFLAVPSVRADTGVSLQRVRGILHMNTDVSSGEYSMETIADMASSSGVDAVFFAENLCPKWEYGIAPFRKVLKKTVEKNGLLRYGGKKYVRRLDLLDDKKDGMTLYHTAEVAPFYYWSGDPFDGTGLTLHDWDLQFLVFGLEPEDYHGIPTVSNGGFSRYTVKSILMLWPLLLLVAGAVSLKYKSSRFYMADPLCWVLILAGIALTLHNYPFKEYKYDQYGGRQGMLPYQDVIGYVKDKGGMLFWSAPEAGTDMAAGPVWFRSTPAGKYMLGTEGYTGFCCFYEGYRSIGGPGGVWDGILKEYCRGDREEPVWAIGEMAFHGSEAGGSKKRVDEVQTVFLVPSNTRENLLKALREGRTYAVRRSEDCILSLDSFYLEDSSSGATAMSGETLVPAGTVTVKFSVSWEGLPGTVVKAALIRDGEVINEFDLTDPGPVKYKDEKVCMPGQRTYYRLDIRGKYPNMLFSNPIFVENKR